MKKKLLTSFISLSLILCACCVWADDDDGRPVQFNPNIKDYTGAYLERFNFSGMNLEGFVFEKAKLDRADFTGANLKGANFRGADIEKATFEDANLENATFENADLEETSLKGANIKNTCFKNTELEYAIWVNGKVCGAGSVGSCW